MWSIETTPQTSPHALYALLADALDYLTSLVTEQPFCDEIEVSEGGIQIVG